MRLGAIYHYYIISVAIASQPDNSIAISNYQQVWSVGTTPQSGW